MDEKREITAPRREYKDLLRELNLELKNYYNPPEFVHGFIDKRSIKSNATPHLSKLKILKIDLSDFFNTIKTEKVTKLFKDLETSLSDEIANKLSRFCSFENKTPQGFPTSPVISNLIFKKLDFELLEIAQKYSLIYTRYADDMVFSSDNPQIPSEVFNSISELIFSSGFKINQEKIKYKGKHRCQIITGLIVNDRLSLKRNYRRNIRAILYNWEKEGYEATQERYSDTYKRNRRAGKPAFIHSLRGKIEFVGFIYGKESKIYSDYRSKLDLLSKRDNVDSIKPY